LAEPADAFHVEPGAVRLAWQGIGTKAQNIAVRVLYLHIAHVRVVRRRIPNFCACGFELFVQRVHVLAVDPDPGSEVPLIADAQEERGAAAGNFR
jgi:hypothetical protein